MSNDPQLQDAEISWTLTLRSSIWGAAATCCETLSAQYSRLTDSVQRELRVLYSSKARAYAQRAAFFEAKSVAAGGIAGYAGGISIADKINQEENPDRVPPNFNIGMDDNYYPVAPAGNESATSAETGGNEPGV